MVTHLLLFASGRNLGRKGFRRPMLVKACHQFAQHRLGDPRVPSFTVQVGQVVDGILCDRMMAVAEVEKHAMASIGTIRRQLVVSLHSISS